MGEIAEYYRELEELDALTEHARRRAKDAIEKASHVWHTRDGRVIPIEKMDDSHLENAIRYFAARGAQSIVSYRNGDRSDDVVAETKMLSIKLITILRYENMVKEREKRQKEHGRGPSQDRAAGGLQEVGGTAATAAPPKVD